MSDQRRYPQRARKSVDRAILDQACEASSTTRKWSLAEKECLLANLEKYGDRDVFLLSTKIGTKSPLAVYTFLKKQKEIAAMGKVDSCGPRFNCLDKWITSMKQAKQKSPQPVPIAVSMLSIALLEDHPVSTDEEVNFPEAYTYLFNLLCGRHVPRLNEPLSMPTKKFIRLTVLSLMKEVSSNFEHFMDKFSLQSETEVREDSLPDSLSFLLKTRHSNPLNVSPDTILNENSEQACKGEM